MRPGDTGWGFIQQMRKLSVGQKIHSLKRIFLAGCPWPDGKSHPGFSSAFRVYICHLPFCSIYMCYVAKMCQDSSRGYQQLQDLKMSAEVAKNVSSSVAVGDGLDDLDDLDFLKAMDVDLQRMDRFVQEIGSKMSSQAWTYVIDIDLQPRCVRKPEIVWLTKYVRLADRGLESNMCCRCYPKLSIGMTRPFESHSGICAAMYLLYFPNRWFAAPIFTPISIILGQEGQLLRLSDVDVQRQKTQKSITRSSESV